MQKELIITGYGYAVYYEAEAERKYIGYVSNSERMESNSLETVIEHCIKSYNYGRQKEVSEQLEELHTQAFFGYTQGNYDYDKVYKFYKDYIKNGDTTVYDNKELCLHVVKIINIINEFRILVENKQGERFYTSLEKLI